MWLMGSLSCIHLKPPSQASHWQGEDRYLYSIRGRSAIFIQLDLKTKENTHTGEVGQQARASWGSRAFLFAPSAQRGDGASFPLVLMEPIMWIHHVATCVLLCFDILVHEITSLGKGLPPLKCSQFPLTIMGQKETYPPLLNSGGQKWNMIRFGECHRKPVGTAGMVWNGPSFIICRHIDGAGVCLTE